MNKEKIKEVFSDEAFVKSLLELDTPEEVQAALAEKDIDLTVEQIMQMRELLVKVQSGEISPEQLEAVQKHSEDGELDEESLEQVAGGLFIADDVAVLIGIGIVTGLAALGAAGTYTHGITGGRW